MFTLHIYTNLLLHAKYLLKIKKKKEKQLFQVNK